MFNKISIIGCGLIGSSILRAARKKKVSKLIYVYDKSKDATSFLKDTEYFAPDNKDSKRPFPL